MTTRKTHTRKKQTRKNISVSTAAFKRAAALAERKKISLSQLTEKALNEFIARSQPLPPSVPSVGSDPDTVWRRGPDDEPKVTVSMEAVTREIIARKRCDEPLPMAPIGSTSAPISA